MAGRVTANAYESRRNYGRMNCELRNETLLAFERDPRRKPSFDGEHHELALDPDYEPAQINRRAIEQMTEGVPQTFPVVETKYYSEKFETAQRGSPQKRSLWQILKGMAGW